MQLPKKIIDAIFFSELLIEQNLDVIEDAITQENK